MTDNTDTNAWRILVVEDDFMIAQDLCSILRDLGYVPMGPAPSIGRALALLETEWPVAALLDENLSGELVTPVAETLARRQIPFAVVSGYARTLSSAPVLQAAERLPKPASRASIGEVLERLLGQRAD